jgi:hypothetical protein
MQTDGTRFFPGFSRPRLGAGLLILSLGLSACMMDERAPERPVTIDIDDKGKEIEKDLPLLFTTLGLGAPQPERTFPEEKRSRIAEVDPAMAANSGALLSGSMRFVFNLFDDVRLVAEMDRSESPEAGRFTLNGRLAGVPGSYFILAYNQGALSATVYHPTLGFYEIEATGGTLGKISEFDPKRLPPVLHGMAFPHGAPHHVMTDSSMPPMIMPKRAAAADPVMDILVLYTPAALAGAGGETAMHSRIDKAVAEMNTAFVNSRINARMRLARAQLVDYVESGDMGTDLGRLQKAGDGYLDGVQALRSTYRADFASLVVEQAGGVAGIGYVMTAVNAGFKDWAYTVVGRVYTGSYHTLSHEVGHNLGCAHDRQNSTFQAAYPYSYGYRFNGTDGRQYRDIMAYAPGTPIPYFSNPAVQYMGAPTGVADGQANSADNARTINLTAPVAEAFYAALPVEGGLPAGWTSQDIGVVGHKGGFAVAGGAYTVKASGADVWNAADGFHYGYQTLNGDGMITARVVSMQNTHEWAMAGVMIRENASPGSRHAFMAVSIGHGLTLHVRETADAASREVASAGTAPYWVRLVRSGTSLKGFASADGVTWEPRGESIQALPQNVLIGLALTSHDNALLNTTVFDNVTISKNPIVTVSWTPRDIGAVMTAGGATGEGTVQVRGDGADIWNNADAFFYWSPAPFPGTAKSGPGW